MYEQLFPEIRPETEKIWNYLDFFFSRCKQKYYILVTLRTAMSVLKLYKLVSSYVAPKKRCKTEIFPKWLSSIHRKMTQNTYFDK